MTNGCCLHLYYEAMKKKKYLGSVLLAGYLFLMAGISGGEVVFRDSFDASLSNERERNLNYGMGTRLAGLVPVTYIKKTSGGGDAVLSSDRQGFEGGVLELTAPYGGRDGKSAAAAGATLLNNFGELLEGRIYTIRVDGQISIENGGSGDYWWSIYLGGKSGLQSPSGAACDFGLLVRADGRAVQWFDGKNRQSKKGVSGVREGERFSLEIMINESQAKPFAQVTFNSGGPGEVKLPKQLISFESDDKGNRYLGMRGHQSKAGGRTPGAKATFLFDNLELTIHD